MGKYFKRSDNSSCIGVAKGSTGQILASVVFFFNISAFTIVFLKYKLRFFIISSCKFKKFNVLLYYYFMTGEELTE